MSHLLFVWKTTGWELREQDGAPMRVTKVAPSPLPGDLRQCAYLVAA